MTVRWDEWRPAGAVRVARGAGVLILRGVIIGLLGVLLAVTWLLIAARRRESLRELASRAQAWGSQAVQRATGQPLPVSDSLPDSP